MSALCPVFVTPTPPPVIFTKLPALVADLFAGAGGFSTGAMLALEELSIPLDLVCVNHWDTAIATHSTNHPTARHYCQDIGTLRPTDAVEEGRLDLLLASPSCTHHSRARGGKPTEDQQRMDPWQVITWLTELRVDRLLVENVAEFREWGPVDPETKKPIKARKREYFDTWVAAIRGLGFEVEWRVLNSADYGEATTRERFFMMARSDGQPIVWPEITHAPIDSYDVLAGVKAPWRATAEIIEWEHPIKSIYTRKRPLSPKTISRIYAGMVKFSWPEGYLTRIRKHAEERGFELPTMEYLLKKTRRRRSSKAVTGVEPFVLSQHAGGAPRAIDEPMPGMTTDGAHALVAPYYGSGSGETCKSIYEPLDTITTKARFGLVVPLTHGGGASRVGTIDQPMPTITTAHRGELAFVVPGFGERPGQLPRVHDILEPTPTICAEGRLNLTVPGEDSDVLFRMFQPRELGGAMGFHSDQVDYEFTGNKTEITKQIGNAVSVLQAKALVKAMFADHKELF